MAGKPSTSNVQAGLFLIVGVALAVAISFALSGAAEKLQRRNEYTVLVSLSEGADGIKPGSLVLVGGFPVGAVKKVELKDEPGDTGRKCVHVLTAVRRDLDVYDDALVFVDHPLLSPLAKINIVSLGNTGKDGTARKLASGDTIPAKTAPPAFLAQAGYGDKQKGQLESIFDKADSTMSTISELVTRNEPTVSRIIANTDDVVGRVKEAAPGIIENVNKTTANISAASEKVGPIVDKVDKGVDEGRTLIGKANTLLDNNSPKVDSILTHAESFTKKLDEEGYAQAMTAVKEFQGTLEKASAFISEQTPNVRKALANARIASDQLKLALTEVRSQPWRVFYQPTRKEIESSVLYDATRSYASAVSDLRAASESLESAVNAPVRAGDAAFERQTIGELNGRLRDAFKNYAAAERSLLETLTKEAGSSATTDGPK